MTRTRGSKRIFAPGRPESVRRISLDADSVAAKIVESFWRNPCELLVRCLNRCHEHSNFISGLELVIRRKTQFLGIRNGVMGDTYEETAEIKCYSFLTAPLVSNIPCPVGIIITMIFEDALMDSLVIGRTNFSTLTL